MKWYDITNDLKNDNYKFLSTYFTHDGKYYDVMDIVRLEGSDVPALLAWEMDKDWNHVPHAPYRVFTFPDCEFYWKDED